MLRDRKYQMYRSGIPDVVNLLAGRERFASVWRGRGANDGALLAHMHGFAVARERSSLLMGGWIDIVG
jgi:hypothetical protein